MSYERDERKRAVWDAINALSEDHREIIVMRDIEGMSYDDISEALDIEIGTVKSRINRARAAIKVFLEKRNFL
jgi:RNA polymerase sigma-70 factor (ECF subfamily)